MNTQNINNSNNESINGMSQVVIDLRPQVKHQDGHGREVLADVHFRIDVQAYTANLYTYTKEAREESEKACEAYYSEVVELLKAEGWTLRKEKFGVGDCPQMVKGTQYLYCHPQDISGQVNPADIEALEAKIKALTTCKFYKTDNYGDIIVTTSESDEKQLYRDTYADGLASIWQEVTTTKRSNLYKDKAEAEHCVRRRICIANRRADLNDIGTGSYNMRSPLLQFLMEEYDRLLQAGYIKEATGQNGRTLCRWINKKEEKELNKARREAEKAEKVKETYKTGQHKALCDELCALLGYKAWEIKKDACTGKFAGSYDYSLKFEDGKELYICTRKDLFETNVTELIDGFKRTSKEGYKHGDMVKTKNSGRVAKVMRVGTVCEGYGTMLYLKEEGVAPKDNRFVEIHNLICSADEVEPLQPASEITETEGIKVGDRVWCKHGKVMGTVTAIRIWNPDYAFKVRLDKPVTLFGQTFEETEFRRAGITKNYDRDGMIVGNAQYYTEQLKYGPASIIEYELAGVALRTESTREDVEPDSREGWGNEYRVTIHHQTGDTTETMTLSETAELLARMYQEEQGKAATLEPASEIKDVPAADLCWDEDEQGVKVWGNMEQHAENLTRMGAKRGRVVFKSNKTGLPTGADCWVLPKTKSEDVRQYVRKVHERIICDFSEAREKYGDKGHKYHEGEKVVTIYGRGTVVRGRAWYASDLIDVQLDTPTYNYIWSLVGTPQKMVAVSRNDIVSIELPEPPKEIIIEDATLQEASEIKPKETDRIESRKRTIIARAKQGKQAWRLVKGCEVRVRKAYTNDSSDPKDWTYCVSWYADGQLVECENGVRLEQAAKALNDLPRWAEARDAA